MTIERLADGGVVTRCETVRGLRYRLQGATGPGEPFSDEVGGAFQATESPTLQRHDMAAGSRFYRLVGE